MRSGRGFNVKCIAQRRAFGDGLKLGNQVFRQAWHIAGDDKQPVCSSNLQIVGGGTQGGQRAVMLPLARIGENVRAALGVGFEIAVGTDGDMADLRADFFDNVVYQGFVVPLHQPFIDTSHPASLPAGQYQCKNFHFGSPLQSRVCKCYSRCCFME